MRNGDVHFQFITFFVVRLVESSFEYFGALIRCHAFFEEEIANESKQIPLKMLGNDDFHR